MPFTITERSLKNILEEYKGAVGLWVRVFFRGRGAGRQGMSQITVPISKNREMSLLTIHRFFEIRQRKGQRRERLFSVSSLF